MKPLVAALAALALAGAAPEPEPTYDIVIRNGRVLDGAGNPWIRADVAIEDGRIARVGTIRKRGAREIDAAGRYLAPGFIDMMDQSGEVLLRTGRPRTTQDGRHHRHRRRGRHAGAGGRDPRLFPAARAAGHRGQFRDLLLAAQARVRSWATAPEGRQRRS